MRVDVATIFPELFEPYLRIGMVGRAASQGVVEVKLHNLRDYTTDRHRKVDDYPYGGGAGMVMKPEPFFRLIDVLQEGGEEEKREEEKAEELGPSGRVPHVVLLTPRGKPYDQAKAVELATKPWLAFLCGHYKGIDARVDTLVDEELSVGDFVLSGGELAAMAVVDSVVRLLPGAVHDHDSVDGDSYQIGMLSCPEYTRPETFRGLRVPEVLTSGHHANIEAWRHEQALALTRERRPDLLDEGAAVRDRLLQETNASKNLTRSGR